MTNRGVMGGGGGGGSGVDFFSFLSFTIFSFILFSFTFFSFTVVVVGALNDANALSN